MRLKPGFTLRKIGGEAVVISMGGKAGGFNGMIKLNETGAFLWEHMQDDFTVDGLASALCESYGIAEAEAQEDAQAFIDTVLQAGVIEDE